MTSLDMGAPFTSFLSLIFLSQLALYSHQVEAYRPKECQPFNCGNVINIQFPFSNLTNPDCGLYNVNCYNNSIPMMKFEEHGRSYVIKSISYEAKQMVIQDDNLLRLSNSQVCNSLHNLTLPLAPFLSFKLATSNYTFLICEHGDTLPGKSISKLYNFTLYNYSECQDRMLYYYPNESMPAIEHNCSTIMFPISEWQVDPYGSKRDLSSLVAAGFAIKWNTAVECEKCSMKKGGTCSRNETTGQFICSGNGKKKNPKRLVIGIPVGVGSFLACVAILICLWFYRKKRISSTSSKMLSSDPSLRSDLERSKSLCTPQFFDYKELEEATNNFDPSKELGDGGFGIVYHGKLRDGRNVAVKRLYENNCRCVEQFKNEIKILSHSRHQNLVTLYGCSSRHNRELLLVYEFIPNGTVADHLHGDRAKPGGLTWPTRMSIAVETADALKYLHAVDIIHRDVKTNNILLDNNFRVKVADFGLSRLFPTNVTHISTAPQGTPGYVDPDYHRCYQLTDKSDVYSFGVVLIELISSKPAVDITRHRHEINLATMALNKIQNSALHELVDPNLGFDTDYGVRSMITSVAELAFRCLQDEKESRPSMEEVLERLREIQSEEYTMEKAESNTQADDEVLLKKKAPSSPDTIIDTWESRSTTPNTSG